MPLAKADIYENYVVNQTVNANQQHPNCENKCTMLFFILKIDLPSEQRTLVTEALKQMQCQCSRDMLNSFLSNETGQMCDLICLGYTTSTQEYVYQKNKNYKDYYEKLKTAVIEDNCECGGEDFKQKFETIQKEAENRRVVEENFSNSIDHSLLENYKSYVELNEGANHDNKACKEKCWNYWFYYKLKEPDWKLKSALKHVTDAKCVCTKEMVIEFQADENDMFCTAVCQVQQAVKGKVESGDNFYVADYEKLTGVVKDEKCDCERVMSQLAEGDLLENLKKKGQMKANLGGFAEAHRKQNDEL